MIKSVYVLIESTSGIFLDVFTSMEEMLKGAKKYVYSGAILFEGEDNTLCYLTESGASRKPFTYEVIDLIWEV